jgi:aminomethyltransferase
MVPFGGWEMPLSYPSGTIAEHQACRSGAVAFDVSHLGTVRVQGPDAYGLLQRTLTNDLGRIAPGRAQ